MPSRGRPRLYPTTAEKNAARAIRRKQYKANPLPPPPLHTRLEHSFITWNPAEGPVADPPITQTTDIFTDLHHTILGDDVVALLDYTSDGSASVDPGIEDNAGEADNMDLEWDSNTGSHNHNDSQHRDDGDEPPPSGMLAATDTEAPRPTYIRVACPAVPLAADDVHRQAILAQELAQQLIQHHGCKDHHQSGLSCESTESGILTAMPLSSLIRSPCPDVLSQDGITSYPMDWDRRLPVHERRKLFSGVESTYTGDGEPSELAGVQEERHPPPVCDPEKDNIQPDHAFQIQFDIDSAGGFASSLAVARQGLHWTAVRPPVSNLTSSLHLAPIPVQFEDPETKRWRRSQQPLHQIPHLPLGRLHGMEAIEVYVLFPHLYHPKRENLVITRDEYILWTDEVFLPALYATYPESVLQHLPASAADAQAKAMATSIEGNTQHNERPRTQLLQYGLQPEYLHALWEQVRVLIDERGLTEFREMKLLLTSKNLKDWTHDRTWISAQSKFFGAWSEAVDATYLTEDFYDIGKEIILPGRSHHFDTEPEEPAVFLTWRRCCLEGFSHWLWDVVDRIDQPPEPQTVSHCVTRSAHRASPHPATDTRSDPPRPRDRHEEGEGSRPENHGLSSRNSSLSRSHMRQDSVASDEPEPPPQKKRSWREEIYPMSLTWAMGSLTMEPSRKSSLRRLGYLYSQHYNSGKAIFAAGSRYVFGNSGLETLALDPGLVRTWEHVGRAVSHSPLALLRAYCHTKHRCHVALTDCRNRTYGIREEYRVTGALLVALDERMQSLGIASQALTVPNESPARSSPRSFPHHRFPFFCHKTGLILDWLRWNINKFCLGFEMVYSLQPRTLVHWEHTRVMMMFLRCLLYTYGGQGAHPRRCNGLWLDRRVRPPAEGSDQERVDEGLGMEQALHSYGYAWLPEHKIDWASMMFRPPHRAHMVFNTPHLLTAYHSRYRELVRVHSDFVIFHDVFTRMHALREDFPRSALLLQLLVDLCLQAFRKDVFEALERSRPAQPFDQHQLELALAGRVPLTIPGFRRIFQHLPPQSEFQFVHSRGARIQHIDVLFACLWGWEGDGNNGDWKRQHWENKPYRILARQCFQSIAHVYGLRQAREWRVTLRHTFIRTHWVLPYPSDRSFWSRSSGTPGRNKLQTWLSGHPGIASFYRDTPDKISDRTPPAGPQRVVISPQEVPALPVSGWQRSEQPMPLDVALPGIPTDLDEYLAALPEPVDTESTAAIPFPVIGVMDGPIHRHVLAEAPERKELRHYLTRNNTTINHIHNDPRWLRKHLQHYLQALAAAELQQASYLTVPRLKRADIAHSKPPSSPNRLPEVLEEDSDEESLKYKQQRAVRKHRIHKAKLQDVQRLVNSFYKEKEHMLQLREKSMSHGPWDEEVVPEYRIMRARQRQVCSLLTRISKQVLEEV